jgi:hypothetical protein
MMAGRFWWMLSLYFPVPFQFVAGIDGKRTESLKIPRGALIPDI